MRLYRLKTSLRSRTAFAPAEFAQDGNPNRMNTRFAPAIETITRTLSDIIIGRIRLDPIASLKNRLLFLLLPLDSVDCLKQSR